MRRVWKSRGGVYLELVDSSWEGRVCLVRMEGSFFVLGNRFGIFVWSR